MSAAGRDWLLRELGDGFTLLIIGNVLPQAKSFLMILWLCELAQAGLRIARARSRPASGGVYLIRPDQHVAARRDPDVEQVRAALRQTKTDSA